MTWVDDLAVSVTASAEDVVAKAIHMMSIIQETMLEHGMVLTYGAGKTAAVVSFRGKGATKARQQLEKTYKNGLQVLTEHSGRVVIPIVSRYKHLGGTHQSTRKLFAGDSSQGCCNNGEVTALEQEQGTACGEEEDHCAKHRNVCLDPSCRDMGGLNSDRISNMAGRSPQADVRACQGHGFSNAHRTHVHTKATIVVSFDASCR